MKKIIALTLGDPFGIGPEIINRALEELQNELSTSNTHIVFIAPKSAFMHLASNDSNQNWINHPNITFLDLKPALQKEDIKGRATFVLKALDHAIDLLTNQKAHTLVTGPIDKSIVASVEPKFSGHTQHLADASNIQDVLMVLQNQEYRIGLLTQHVLLNEVSKSITREKIVTCVNIATEGLKRWFNISKPKIAILGLNPHCGEQKPNTHEQLIMRPAIDYLLQQNIDIHGPFGADGFFPSAKKSGFDMVLCPYHDQGLVAAKYNGIDHVVNMTFGLPFFRVSPGHGVAYDLVGQNKASAKSITLALRTAMKVR